jgi:glycosyltransferase involved in cell wall biosynthesis
LLETAAMGKPLITTDVPGCREAVDDGVTGFLCKVRDADDLAAKMIAMVDMGEGDRAAMGAAGRAKMERQFDEGIVIDAYLQVLRSILCARPNESPDVERVPAA